MKLNRYLQLVLVLIVGILVAKNQKTSIPILIYIKNIF